MEEDFSKYNGEGTILRKAQLRMLDIMVKVDEILRRNKIDYYLDCGSVLGAVRHGGFIPWDDDLDIAVKLEDMPRIRKVLSEQLPEDLVFHDMSNDFNYYMVISKVRDRNSLFDDPYSKKMKYRGIYIDIIPMEEILSIRLKHVIDFVYIRCLRGIHNFNDRIIEKILGYLCFLPARLAVALCRLAVMVVHTHKWDHAYGWNIYGKKLDETDLFPTKDIVFEGVTLRAPANPDGFLRTLFGDYMQVPPPEKRITHNANITFY